MDYKTELQQRLVHTSTYSDSYVSRSRLDSDLYGSSAAHLVQRLLVVLELKDIGDLIHTFQDNDPLGQ
jgi:hypothetical protein